MTARFQNDLSMSIELDDEDLLDIDGSDDPTTAFAGKNLLARMAMGRKKRSPFARVVDDPTIVLRDSARDDIRETIPVPMRLAVVNPNPSAPPAATAPVPGSIAPKSPTISPVPPVKTRNADSSYPPIAVPVPPPRDRAMSFVSERPSRAGWITAAVIGALILVGGSIKVAAPKAQAAAEPAAVVAAEPPPAADQEEPKVVTFGANQGVSIRSKADAKDAKAEPKKPAAARPQVAAPKTASKAAPSGTAKLPDGSLTLSKDTKDAKEDKIPSTSHDAPVSKAEQKKLKSIEQELADAQLKAAAR